MMDERRSEAGSCSGRNYTYNALQQQVEPDDFPQKFASDSSRVHRSCLLTYLSIPRHKTQPMGVAQVFMGRRDSAGSDLP